MNLCQIWAGKVPPATVMPCTLVIAMRASGCPTQTAVESWGMKPQNQASLQSSVVPVLPAAGRSSWAAVPVP